MSVRDNYVNLLAVMDDCTDSYMFVFDLTNDHYTISTKALKTFAFEDDSFYNATSVLKNVIYEPDFEMLSEDIEMLKSGKKKSHDLEYRWLDREGNPIWISCKGRVVYEENSLLMIGSVTEQGKKSKYDNVTSLYSESVFEERYAKLADAGQETGYVLLIGVDNFRNINEKYGMKAGDKVLADIAECIIKCIGDKNNIYRFKGDEFAIVTMCDKKDAIEEAKELYKKIRAKIDDYIEAKNYSIFYTISGGAYAFDTATDSFDKVLHNLRFALHCAKLKGKNTFEGYSEDSYDNYITRMDIQEELRRCITEGFEGFEVYYQPVIKADSGEIYGAEALIRWNSQTYGFVSPVRFVPLLEESSLIIPLGKWIIEQAVIQCKKWLEVVPDFTMNINLSFVQILKSDILKDVLECVDYHGISHEHIVFEATESGELENNSAVKNVLVSFNDNCFRLAIDDFGTGYSNLKYIRDMMFSIIKIDRLFIQNIDKSDDNYTLVKYIIEMAHSLNIGVCVEGVETEQELDCVMTLKPDCIQGYYYGKPMTCGEFTQKFMV